MTNNETKKGTVKWFNDTKGFGFIAQETGGEDVFVHYSAIASDGYRSLREGQEVQFELAKADKGWRAANVRLSGDSEQDAPEGEVSPAEAAALDSLMGEN